MSSVHFFTGWRMGAVAAGIVILLSFWGCEKSEESADAGIKDGVKLTVLNPRGQPSGIFGRVGEAGAGMLANRNPDTQPKMSRDELIPLRMAPRLDSLENKTIYLVDTGFEGGKAFLEEMQVWCRERCFRFVALCLKRFKHISFPLRALYFCGKQNHE